MAGLVIGGAAITLAIWLSAALLSNRQTAAAASTNLRLQIDEIGMTLQQDLADAPQAYLFSGQLLNPDATPYTGTGLTFSQPLHQIATAAQFLAATGLSLGPAGGADYQTIVAVPAPSQPIVFTRRSLTASTGWTIVRLQYSGRYGTRSVSFSVPPSTSGSRLAAVGGGAALDPTDQHVVLTLPNPLAMASVMLPQANAGTVIDCNLQTSQIRP